MQYASERRAKEEAGRRKEKGKETSGISQLVFVSLRERDKKTEVRRGRHPRWTKGGGMPYRVTWYAPVGVEEVGVVPEVAQLVARARVQSDKLRGATPMTGAVGRKCRRRGAARVRVQRGHDNSDKDESRRRGCSGQRTSRGGQSGGKKKRRTPLITLSSSSVRSPTDCKYDMPSTLRSQSTYILRAPWFLKSTCTVDRRTEPDKPVVVPVSTSSCDHASNKPQTAK